MPGNFYDKFPGEVREFDADASGLISANDSIASVSCQALAGGITASNPNFSGSMVYATIGGGQPGQIAFALFRVTLASGQIREAPIAILIKPYPGA
jgi:hypothetical protein